MSKQESTFMGDQQDYVLYCELENYKECDEKYPFKIFQCTNDTYVLFRTNNVCIHGYTYYETLAGVKAAIRRENSTLCTPRFKWKKVKSKS